MAHYKTETLLIEAPVNKVNERLDHVLNHRRFSTSKLVSVAPYGPPSAVGLSDTYWAFQFLVTWEVP